MFPCGEQQHQPSASGLVDPEPTGAYWDGGEAFEMLTAVATA